MAQIQQMDSNFKCDMCERDKRSNGNLKNHIKCEHGIQVGNECRLCERETSNESDLNVHTKCEHMFTVDKECKLCQIEQPKDKIAKTHY